MRFRDDGRAAQAQLDRVGKVFGGATVASLQGLILLALAWAVDVHYSVSQGCPVVESII